MSEGPTSYPPPGASPPPYPAPQHPAPAPAPGAWPPPGVWQPGPPGGPTPPPGLFLGAAHKPGAFPLRPLTLGMIWDGAFRIIRFNPRATVGAAVLVTSVAMLIPIVVTGVLSFTVGLGLDASGELSTEASTGELIGFLASAGSLLVSLLVAQVGVVLVTGMVAHVARAAAVGRRLDLGGAWAATRGKRWRLLALSLLINLAIIAMGALYVLAWVLVVLLTSGPWPVVVWGLLSVPAFLAALAYVWTRLLYLPVPVLMLEDVGVGGAFARSWRLTSGHFWRTFGIGLLTAVVGSVAGSLISTPIALAGTVVGAVVPEHAFLALVVSQALGLVLQYAFYAPFVAAVGSVQYVDLRMRSEAYDVELLREAGIIAR